MTVPHMVMRYDLTPIRRQKSPRKGVLISQIVLASSLILILIIGLDNKAVACKQAPFVRNLLDDGQQVDGGPRQPV